MGEGGQGLSGKQIHAGETTAPGQRAQISASIRGTSSAHVGHRSHGTQNSGSEFGGGGALWPYEGRVSRHEPGRGPGERRDRPAIRQPAAASHRSEEHTSELQSLRHLVCRLLLEKKK